MTLKWTITQEFLDSVGDPRRIEDIFIKYKRSKGPLYLGLADATARLRDQLEGTASEVEASVKKRNAFVEDVDVLEGRRIDLSAEVEQINKRIVRAGDDLAETEGQLDLAGQLDRMGFSIEQLAQLSVSIERIRGDKNSQHEALSQFFRFIERYESFTSLEADLQGLDERASEAKTEVAQLEAALESTQTRTNARTEAVELAERLLERGVGYAELALWEDAVSGLGAARETVTHELQEFGSLHKARETLGADTALLRTEITAAETRLSDLRNLETGVKSSIVATRDSAVSRIDTVGEAALRNLEELMGAVREYDELKRQAEALGEDIRVARAFRSVDVREWEQIPRWAIQRILMGLISWSKSVNGDRLVPPPEPVRQRTKSLSQWTRVSNTDLLFWVLSGTFTDQERKTMLESSVR